MIKYLGSKRALVPVIAALARGLGARTACDVFAGTTRVGQGLREAGLRVISNDTASYSEAFGHAYVEADERTLDRTRLRRLLEHLSALPGEDGYVTETFCRRSRFFRPENGRRIDAVRAGIERLPLSRLERGALLTSLVEAADRVDSTCGLQMAYLKRYAPRAANPLCLREPDAVSGPAGAAVRMDANALARALEPLDLAYVDPPYNQHSYFANYHVWESLVRNDAPPVYGVACKRRDCRERRSPYNSRRRAWDALRDLVEHVPARSIVVSVSEEGFHDPAAVEHLLAERGYAGSLAVDAPRYVGARIGIHNPRGERVGTVSHVRTRELLVACAPSRRRLDDALTAAASARPHAAPAARTDSGRSRRRGTRAAS